MTAVTQVGDPRTRPLPPGVTEADLERAVESFTEALGSDRVLTSEEALDEFRDPFAPATWDDYTASAVVMPETVEEIQAIVRIANELRIPLWTHSAGMNNGYGGPAPRVHGLGDRQPAAHEPRARDQRGVRLRGRRAGRPLVRPLQRVQQAATS